MNTTTNLGLLKPEYSDVADIKDINDNMDTLDGVIGELPEGKTVQGQIDDINDEIGDTALPTTAQTVTGAIAEHETDLGTKLNKDQGSGNSGKVMVVDEDGEIVPTDFPSTPIDDTKGLGDTDFVWSADKGAKEVIRLDGIKANNDSVYATKTVSNDVIEIDDAVAEAVKQMRIEIAPVQDLHGYDHPWAGGAGKNLYDISQAGNSICTVSGNTATLVATTSFQASASVFVPVSTGDYKVSFTGSTGASLEVKMFKSDKSTSVGDTVRVTSSATITVSDSEVAYIRVLLSNGNSGAGTYTYNNVQVESGTTVTDYEPYSNICPISGWTGAKVNRYSKNLFNKDTALIKKYISANGVVSNSDNWSASDFIRVSENTTYTLSGVTNSGTAAKHAFYNSSMNFISDVASTTYTFTTPANTAYVRLSLKTETPTSVQLEEGSTATTYDGSAKTYSITFQSSAGTVYGGTLTVNQDGTGVLTKEWVNLTFNTASDFTSCDRSGQSTLTGAYWASMSKVVSSSDACIAESPASGGDGNGLFNRGQWRKDAVGTEWRAYAGTTTNLKVIITSKDYDLTDQTVRDSFIANNSPLQVAYKIATPVTYTLTTDQVLHLLSGVNNIWSDCGVTTLLYPTDKYLTIEQADKERIHESITVPAPVQTISDGADNLPMEVTVGIEPVQDLHGYEYPWVGGTKNLYGATLDEVKTLNTNGTWSNNQYTYNGVTFTVNVDANGYVSSISTSGTASAVASCVVSKAVLTQGVEYTVTGCPSGGSSSKYELMAIHQFIQGGQSIAHDYGSGATYTADADRTSGVQVVIRSGQNSSGLVFYPMIRLSSITDGTWMPYSNICPISGHTGVEVTRTGKNLMGSDAMKENALANNPTKISWDSTNRYLYWERYTIQDGVILTHPFKENTQYTFIFTMYKNSSIASLARIYYTDGTYSSIPDMSSTGTKCTVVKTSTAGKTVAYIGGMNNYEGTARLYVDESGIFEGVLTAQDFEAYKGDTYSITFLSSAGTVYGGTLKVNKDGSGELTVTHAKETRTGASDESYNTTISLYGMKFSFSLKNQTPKVAGTALDGITSNYMREVTNSSAWGLNCTLSRTLSSFTSVYAKIDDVSRTDEELKAYFAEHPLELCYPLLDPIVYTIPATIIRSLLGTNNVRADTGNILELNYAADSKRYIDKKLSASQNLMELIITANREDSMTATKAYTTGNLMIVNGTLYKATTSIANGATLTVGTNVTATTVAAEIAAMS